MSEPKRLTPVSSAFLHEANDAFIFMTATNLERELDVFLAAVPIDNGETFEQVQHDLKLEASTVVEFLSFVQAPSVGELRNALAQTPENQILLIQYRLYQLKTALRYAVHIEGEDFSSTEIFAVSPVWSKRWGGLLAGRLLPAYIGYVNVESFQP